MFKTHPLAAIPANKRMSVFLPLLVLTLSLMVILNMSATPLTTGAAPLGIVSFELAGSVSRAQAILDSWNSAAQLHAAFGLGLDYLYMPLYATTIGLACLWAADVLRRRRWPASQAGMPLAWGLWLAAVCDVGENLALITMMFGVVADPWPAVSFWFASIKFVLIVLGLIYAVYGVGAALSRKLARASRRES
jgi:hypothetical protein